MLPNDLSKALHSSQIQQFLVLAQKKKTSRSDVFGWDLREYEYKFGCFSVFIIGNPFLFLFSTHATDFFTPKMHRIFQGLKKVPGLNTEVRNKPPVVIITASAHLSHIIV